MSPDYHPLLLKGLQLFPQEPLRFDFIVDPGNSNLTGPEFQSASAQRIKHFMTALTVPQEDLWVNLSSDEKDRIIPNAFGVTEMGRDLLAQGYFLKQMTASLMYPEDDRPKVAKLSKMLKE